LFKHSTKILFCELFSSFKIDGAMNFLIKYVTWEVYVFFPAQKISVYLISNNIWAHFSKISFSANVFFIKSNGLIFSLITWINIRIKFFEQTGAIKESTYIGLDSGLSATGRYKKPFLEIKQTSPILKIMRQKLEKSQHDNSE